MSGGMIKVTRTMIERGARAIYRNAGWDRAWKDIAPEGRRRFRKAALDAIIAAIPNAIRVTRRS
jgi:hypothetical protein